MNISSLLRKLYRLRFFSLTLWAILAGSLLFLCVQKIEAVSWQAPNASSSASIIIQEDDPSLVISGTWNSVDDDKASGGAYLESNEVGAQLSLTFTGTSIALYRQVDLDGGFAFASLDGDFREISFYRFEAQPQTPYIFEQLSKGVHTLTVTVPSPAPPDETPGYVKIDAFAIPSNITHTVVQQQSLDRVNYYRQLMNLPLAQSDEAVQLGAQAHAEYLAINRNDPSEEGLGAHEEKDTLPGYVGDTPDQRAASFGYDAPVGEDVHFFGDPVKSVDGWMSTIYHRTLITCYDCTDGGYGVIHDDRGDFDVLDLGSGSAITPEQRFLYTYPISNQTDVPTRWDGGEVPDPLPDVSGDVGYPISLHIAQPQPVAMLDTEEGDSPKAVLTSAELRDDKGKLVPAYVLDQASDPNHLLEADNFFLIPQQPLAYSSTYHAQFSGTDSQGAPFTDQWSFSTGAGTTPTDLSVEASPCSAQISWQTERNLTSDVRYGTTANQYPLQTRASSEIFSDTSSISYTATLANLTPNTLYHYQIVEQDEHGNQLYAGADESFTTPAPHLYAIAGNDAAALQDALAHAKPCDVVQVAAGTYSGDFHLPSGVQLTGAGAESTILQDTTGSVLEVDGDNLISGFTIQNSGPGDNDAGIYFVDKPTGVLHDLRIQNNQNGILIPDCEGACSGQLSIHNNIIVHNRSQGISLGKGIDNAQIINNTIVDSEWDISNYGSHTNIRNNIIAQGGDFGIFQDPGSDAQKIAYNDLWQNGADDENAQAGEGTFAGDPSFADANSGNYALASGSPAIDAGDPNPIYNDADGSRNDMGATGGQGGSNAIVIGGNQLFVPAISR